MPRRHLGLALLLASAPLAACSHGHAAGPQPTPAGETTTTSTTEPDLSSVKLAGIPGRWGRADVFGGAVPA